MKAGALPRFALFGGRFITSSRSADARGLDTPSSSASLETWGEQVSTAADDYRDRVAWTARLSRLALGSEEAEALARDLDSVLAHVAVLEELDTSGVAPFVPVVVAADPWRDDVVEAGLSRADALAAAPVERAGQFWVPRIVSAQAEGETPGESR